MKNTVLLTEEKIIHKIYLIRDKKVMFDRDLAEMYGVETRVLNQSVKRNLKRFPEDFMPVCLRQVPTDRRRNGRLDVTICDIKYQ